jgi:hypothetical protein
MTHDEATQSTIDWILREYNVDLRKELNMPKAQGRFIKAKELGERLGIDGEGQYKAYHFNLMCWALGLIRPYAEKGEGWAVTKKGEESRLVRRGNGYVVEFLPETLTEVSKLQNFNFEHAKAMHVAVMDKGA